MRRRSYPPLVWFAEQYVPLVWVSLGMAAVTAGLMYAIAHQPPPSKRALNLRSLCVESLEGTSCIPTTPPFSDASPRPLPAAVVDAGVQLPGAAKGARYVRYYLLKTIRSEEDLPFSGSHVFKLREPREVWLALFIRTPSGFSSDPPGLRVVEDARKFPQVDHGGCLAVNVVADARTGATLGSWCNVMQLPGGAPGIVHAYFPSGSPIMPSGYATPVE